MQKIDFLYFDLKSCQRCIETERNLHDALDELGVNARIIKHKMKSHEQQVKSFGRVISPSIFLNGKDIFSKTSTTSCDDCSNLFGGKSVNCRAGCGVSDQFTKREIKGAISESLIS